MADLFAQQGLNDINPGALVNTRGRMDLIPEDETRRCREIGTGRIDRAAPEKMTKIQASEVLV